MTGLPALTPEQREQLLRRSAAARDARLQLREDLASGRQDLATVLRAGRDDQVIGRTGVAGLLLAWGKPGQAYRILEQAGVPRNKRVRAMNDTERRDLVAAVETFRASVQPTPTSGSELDTLRDEFVGCRLGPALGWPGVHAFEAEHGIVLPEPYRSFVATVANGCEDGPAGHGLVPLGASCEGSIGHAVEPGSLARPFPLTSSWIWDVEDDEPDPELLRRVHHDGFVPLGTDGGGEDWVLVVTGEQRGRVWSIDSTGAQPFGNGTDFPGFADWVGCWANGRDWWDR